MTKRAEDTYEFSVCSESALRQYWPDSMTPDCPEFERNMIECQLALIECKVPIMYREDKARALETVRYLKQCRKAGAYL